MYHTNAKILTVKYSNTGDVDGASGGGTLVRATVNGEMKGWVTFPTPRRNRHTKIAQWQDFNPGDRRAQESAKEPALTLERHV